MIVRQEFDARKSMSFSDNIRRTHSYMKIHIMLFIILQNSFLLLFLLTYILESVILAHDSYWNNM